MGGEGKKEITSNWEDDIGILYFLRGNQGGDRGGEGRGDIILLGS